MIIPYTRWPEELAARYREKGYWLDEPLNDILQRHAENDAVALTDGDRTLTYRELEQAAHRLAAALVRRGLRRGDTALVQLGNVAEFYIAFFALLKIGVAPVNALFSHQRTELEAYARQIEPALLIADREHALFASDAYLAQLRECVPSIREVVLHRDNGEASMARLIEEPAQGFIATPTPADEVAFFQLSGGSTGTPKLIPRTHNDYYYSIRRSNEICRFDANIMREAGVNSR